MANEYQKLLTRLRAGEELTIDERVRLFNVRKERAKTWPGLARKFKDLRTAYRSEEAVTDESVKVIFKHFEAKTFEDAETILTHMDKVINGIAFNKKNLCEMLLEEGKKEGILSDVEIILIKKHLASAINTSHKPQESPNLFTNLCDTCGQGLPERVDNLEYCDTCGQERTLTRT